MSPITFNKLCEFVVSELCGFNLRLKHINDVKSDEVFASWLKPMQCKHNKLSQFDSTLILGLCFQCLKTFFYAVVLPDLTPNNYFSKLFLMFLNNYVNYFLVLTEMLKN